MDLNFREWIFQALNESIFYKMDKMGGVYAAKQLPGLALEKKEFLKQAIIDYLASPKENWQGSPFQFVKAIRHNFLDYNEKMDQLRNWPADKPGLCKKIPIRIQNVKDAYALVKGIITHLTPDILNVQMAHKANYEWLIDQINFYKSENDKLRAGCNLNLFIIPAA